MKKSWIPISIFLALSGVLVVSQTLPSTLPSMDRQGYVSARSPGAAWVFDIAGKHYRAKITRDEVNAGPDWGPFMDLPLSFTQAEQIARTELKKLVADAASWSVNDFQLKRIPGESKWFFVIGMRPPVSGFDRSDSFFAVMNLSGNLGTIEENPAPR